MHRFKRGVNLGGWLILEQWLTPGVFAGTDAVDEYTLSRTTGGPKRIATHRKTFITEADFEWLARHDVDLVRLPVGYWLFEKIDGFVPAVGHVNNAMKWAEKHNIKVLIDFHAARGSQNGFDSSGRMGRRDWYGNKSYQAQTLELLERIAREYKDEPALWGIELLNEPVPKRHYFTLLRFHRKAYDTLRRILRPETVIVFHDAFQPWFSVGTFRKRDTKKPHPIIMDVHWYAYPLNTKSVRKYIRQSATLRRLLLRCLSWWQPVIVGEWSTVLPQRFFDASPKSDHMKLLSQNAAMQLQEYDHAVGSIYWNYKAEGEGMWNYRSLLENGVIAKK